MHYFLPVLALLFNALVWGVSWWPFRLLHSAGLHPLWTTALMSALALLGLLLLRPAAWRWVRQHPSLWLLALASGLSNVGFNWAVTVGDVVRVVLLFYLMPAWSVLLAWKMLGEVPTPMALLRLVLAFGGMVLVVLPAGMPLGQLASDLSGADLLAIGGGFCFALTNVTLRRLHDVPDEGRVLAMFAGGMLTASLGAGLAMAAGMIEPVPPLAVGWVLPIAALALVFLLGNYALQFGAGRLAAGTTALVMLTEVVFASVSSVLLGATVLQPRTLAGGALIVLAALLSIVTLRRTNAPLTHPSAP